jgi:hypothetical protein
MSRGGGWVHGRRIAAWTVHHRPWHAMRVPAAACAHCLPPLLPLTILIARVSLLVAGWRGIHRELRESKVPHDTRLARWRRGAGEQPPAGCGHLLVPMLGAQAEPTRRRSVRRWAWASVDARRGVRRAVSRRCRTIPGSLAGAAGLASSRRPGAGLCWCRCWVHRPSPLVGGRCGGGRDRLRTPVGAFDAP